MITDLYSYILYKSNLIHWLYSISESDKFLSTTALKLISDLNNNILSTTPAYDLLFKKYKFKVSLQSVGNGQTLSFVLYQYNPSKNSFTFVGVIKNVTVCACNSEDLPTPTPSPTPTPTPTSTSTPTPTPTSTSTPTPTPTPGPTDTPTPTPTPGPTDTPTPTPTPGPTDTPTPTPTPGPTDTPTPTPTPGPTDTPTPTPTPGPTDTPTPTPTPGPVEPTPTPTPTNTPAPTDTPTPTPTPAPTDTPTPTPTPAPVEPTPTPTPTNTPAPTATPTPTPTITNTPTPSPTATPTPTPTPDPGIQLFMVGGGGAGGDKINSVVASEPAMGGGGSGAYVLTNTFIPVAGVTYNFVVGSGGDSISGSVMANRNGQTTMFADTYYAGGGGGGASYINGVALAAGDGVYGGGGGGGGVAPDGTLIAAGSGDGSGGSGGVGVEAVDYRVGGSGGGYNSSGVSGQLLAGPTAQGGLGTAVMTAGEIPTWFDIYVDTLIANAIAGSGGGNSIKKTGVVGSTTAPAPGQGRGASDFYGPDGRGRDGGMPTSAGQNWGAGNGGGAGFGPYTSGFGGDGFIAYIYPNTWSTPVVTYTGNGNVNFFNYSIITATPYKILFIYITSRNTNAEVNGRGWGDGMKTYSGTVRWDTVV